MVNPAVGEISLIKIIFLMLKLLLLCMNFQMDCSTKKQKE